MKRIWILLIILIGTTARALPNSSEAVKDSLLKVLNTLPANTERLELLYTLACQEPTSPSCIYYSDKLLKEATEQDNKEYQCLATYAHVIYYYNQMDEDNTVLWMEKLSELALKHKFYNWYFAGKRAEITIHIINRKIEYSITQAEEMFKLAQSLDNANGMYNAKLCLMNAYLMSARFKEGEKAGFDAYRLLPDDASLENRKSVLQEIALACSSTQNKEFLRYLVEFNIVLDKLSEKNSLTKARPYNSNYLLLESLYADYYMNTNQMDEARKHLKKMDEYFSPTDYIPCRGLYFNVYSHYYRITKQYDKALVCSDSVIKLLSDLSESGGTSYLLKRAAILTDAGQVDEAIPLFQSSLAKKDSFYRDLSTSQMNEIYQMRNMDNLLLEKEQHKAILHGIGLALIAIALLILIPSTIRIYYVRKKLKKEEEEIRKMTRIAEEANEVKDRFLANMSYNIRIPLNNVLGFSQLMTLNPESMDADQWKEYSEIIQSNSTELIQLVNDVLDLSRLEAGRTKWKLQEYDMVILCSEAMSMLRMKSENKIQVNFRTDIESESLQVDVSRFTQVILSTLAYADPCEEPRTLSFTLHRDPKEEHLVFRIVNSPLADPELQTQKVEVRHSINRLTVTHFGGTYTILPDEPEGPTMVITYPYSDKNQSAT